VSPAAAKAAIGALACCFAESVCSLAIVTCSLITAVGRSSAKQGEVPVTAAIARTAAASFRLRRGETVGLSVLLIAIMPSVVLRISDLLHPVHVRAVDSVCDGRM